MMQQRSVASSIGILVSCLVANPAYSQIIPDGTTNTSIVNDCRSSCNIGGGAIAEQNLFHSFKEFNIAPGARVYFDDPGVANIFSRITGNNPSEIFGTLGISGGDANLFLLNPNGIVFGKGAALDLNGSFFATTADEIQFGDRALTTQPDGKNLALLTVDPSALWFNQFGQNGSIILDGANLKMPAGQSITLLGKQVGDRPGIFLSNASLNVSEGNIGLGAVGSNTEVKLDNDLGLQFSPSVIRGDITLKGASKIGINNLGNFDDNGININANSLTIAGDSTITTTATGTSNGANIYVNATDSVAIRGERDNGFQQYITNNLTPGSSVDFVGSSLQTTTLATGNAGNIKVATPNLSVERGAGIFSITQNQGTSGNITIAADSFNLQNSGLLTGSGIFTVGEIGEIKIDTSRLLVERGGIISSSTSGDGNAGNLTINAADSIEVRESLADSIIPTGIFTNTVFGNGKGGELRLDTKRLIVRDGGQLSSSSGATTRQGFIPLGGQAGNITINAAESVEVGGISADKLPLSRITTDTITNNPAGNLTINTGSLLLDAYGSISAWSLGTGTGGDIVVNAAESVELVGIGTSNLQQVYADLLVGQVKLESTSAGLSALTVLTGDAGNISLNTSNLSLKSGAILATGTLGEGDAGNLNIVASDRIDIEGSLIAAPTLGIGDAGKIDLATKRLNLTNGSGITSVSAGSGNGGDIFISATESIEISNTSADVLFAGTISTASFTNLSFPGDIIIDTKRLSLKDGANIQTDNVSIDSVPITEVEVKPVTNNPTKLTINASEFIEISGASPRDNPFSVSSNSQISSTVNTPTRASDINITTANLSLADGGEISVNSLGEGIAGKLTVVADSVYLENRGRLNGTTSSGRGGNILLEVDNILRLKNNSSIDTNAISLGDGGNIDLTADFVIASENSSISANAAAIGDGGKIDITAKKLFITPDSKITADSNFGIDGTVEINTSLDNEQNNYTELPQKVIQAENKIVSSCGNGNDARNVFSYTGRGGLPSNPLREFQTDNIVIADLEIPEYSTVEELDTGRIIPASPKPVIEADRWKINSNGKVELVSTTVEDAIASTDLSSCPFAPN